MSQVIRKECFNLRGRLVVNLSRSPIIEDPRAGTIITELRAAGKHHRPAPGMPDTFPDRVGTLTITRCDDGSAAIDIDPSELASFGYIRAHLDAARKVIVREEIIGDSSLWEFPRAEILAYSRGQADEWDDPEMALARRR